MTLQQKLVQADDYLDILKDKAKETDELAKENLQLRKKFDRAINALRKSDRKIERLNEEVEKYKRRCFKGLKLIRDNYGVLDKYGLDILDDILNGVDKE